MVKYHMARLDDILAAVSHPRRRAILARLMKGEATVLEIARPIYMSLPAVSKHIRVLEDAGLVKREVRGREHWMSLNAEPLQEVLRWIEGYRDFWEEQRRAEVSNESRAEKKRILKS